MGGEIMVGLFDPVLHVKTSIQLLSLLDENCIFVWREDEQREIKINLHAWKNYAFYEFTDMPRHGICPIGDLWSFVKLYK